MRHRAQLVEIARQAMIDRGFEPDFSDEIRNEAANLPDPPPIPSDVEDLRDILWCSIDNDDTRDIDQLTWAGAERDGRIRIRIGIADVDHLVPLGSAIDRRAAKNTTTVYTPAKVFPMLPTELSEDRTSLNEGADRTAIVMEMVFDTDGAIHDESVYQAVIRNHAKLAYDSLAEWLEGEREALDKVTGNSPLEENLRLQDEAAQRLFVRRHDLGALDLETTETRAVIEDEQVVELVDQRKNRARQLIEDFMIAANGVTTRFLEARRSPTFRRIVREPRRWDRIVAIAADKGFRLSDAPDPRSLDEFLLEMRERDPLRFPDLSLTVVKLIGSGEYAVELPGEPEIGHFGLAVEDYSHSTAPNRRYPDIITHRLLKAAFENQKPPYTVDELHSLAAHCTEQEDDAKKIQRLVGKSAAAMLLESRVGETFDGIVTGASSKGTWARIFRPPVEGKVVRGWEKLDVGDRVRVKLLGVDVERGFIDFARTR